MYKEQRRKQERLHRSIEEQLRQDVDPGEAIENAMRSEGMTDLPEETAEPGFADESDLIVGACGRNGKTGRGRDDYRSAAGRPGAARFHIDNAPG